MDLMKHVDGLTEDIRRLVMDGVRFKRSYNCVIIALHQKFVREAFARPGWWDTTVQLTGTCISICNDMRTGNMERSRNVSYWYLQNFKGQWVDNVRSSYLIRKIKDVYDDPTIDWASAPGGDVWEIINYCEAELLEIWDYYWQDQIYTIQHELFFPSFGMDIPVGGVAVCDVDEHIYMGSFDKMGRDRWRSTLGFQ